MTYYYYCLDIGGELDIYRGSSKKAFCKYIYNHLDDFRGMFTSWNLADCKETFTFSI